MKTIDLGDSVHTFTDSGVLNYTAGTYRYLARLPMRSQFISTAPLSADRASLFFGNATKTTVVLHGPTSTIEALFARCGGEPIA